MRNETAGAREGLGAKGGSLGLGFRGGWTHLRATSRDCSVNQARKTRGKLHSILSNLHTMASREKYY